VTSRAFRPLLDMGPQKEATIVVLANNYNASGFIDASMVEMVIQKELYA